MAPRILIIAYGNPLRSDDGIAWRAAEALEGKFSPESVEIVRLHQLAPELADTVRNRDLVLFLDAACVESADSRAGEIQFREVCGSETDKRQPGNFTHIYSPAKVLALAGELYGSKSKAWIVTVTGEDFGHGERPSASVMNSLPGLIVRIEQLVRSEVAKAETTKGMKLHEG